jgi:hypothetical protein
MKKRPKRMLVVMFTAALAGAGWATLLGITLPAPFPADRIGAAPGPPDFSGTWALNVWRSEFAGEQPPQSKLQRVEHAGSELVVTIDEISDRGTVHGVARYTTDGQDAVNDVLGFPMTSSIAWDGDVMVMRTWGKFRNADIMLIDRWSLAPDGKTLTIARQFQGHGRIVDQTLVFDRK